MFVVVINNAHLCSWYLSKTAQYILLTDISSRFLVEFEIRFQLVGGQPPPDVPDDLREPRLTVS